MEVFQDWKDGKLQGTYDLSALKVPPKNKPIGAVSTDELYSALKPLRIVKPTMGRHEMKVALARYLNERGEINKNVVIAPNQTPMKP